MTFAPILVSFSKTADQVPLPATCAVNGRQWERALVRVGCVS
jgi:hypothetical protein